MSVAREAIAGFDPRLFLAGAQRHGRRLRTERRFRIFATTVASLSCLILAVLLVAILASGIGTLGWTFLTAPPHPDPAQAGLHPAIWGTVWLMVLTALFALPTGVAAAIILEEFHPRKNKFAQRMHGIVQLNVTNLAGVPSVVYGIIGLTAFAAFFNTFGTIKDPALEVGVHHYDQFYNEADHIILRETVDPSAEPAPPVHGSTVYNAAGETFELNVIAPGAPFPSDPALAARTVRADEWAGQIQKEEWYYFRIPFGRGILTGALTLMLVILPVIIIAAQEALRAVPSSLRQAASGLGATPWQVVWRVTLPGALPGIMTASIIAMSRAIGEAAPLLMIAGIVFITNPPGNLMDDFTAMPLQVYNWAGRPQADFHKLAAAGIIVLLAVLLFFNAVAVIIRQKTQRTLT